MIQEMEMSASGRAANGRRSPASRFSEELESFRDFGKRTRVTELRSSEDSAGSSRVPVFVNEFWTAKQRDAHSLHEISYRACFKPQLPRFFIERFTQPGDVVYDPFMGRGTTLVEAALLGRIPWGCDVNPLCSLLVAPRLAPPTVEQVAERLAQVDFADGDKFPEELLVFFHPETLREICALKNYLATRRQRDVFDAVDAWIQMIALNRLTGHSSGFFSVYTLPPNQAVSVQAQAKINARLGQTPPRRDVPTLILKKTRSLLVDCETACRTVLAKAAPFARVLTSSCDGTPQLPTGGVDLIVTSPPFLDVVNYAADNWLRCWFAGIDPQSVPLAVHKRLHDWQAAMTGVFHELRRVLKPGGHIAFEVGEVRGGKVRLEEAVLHCADAVGLEPILVLINDQQFTKTANCWGVLNGSKGTNTNRIVLLRKAA